MHDKILWIFQCVEYAHLILLSKFIEALASDYYPSQISELWLRYMLNGGKAAALGILNDLMSKDRPTIISQASEVTYTFLLISCF